MPWPPIHQPRTPPAQTPHTMDPPLPTAETDADTSGTARLGSLIRRMAAGKDSTDHAASEAALDELYQATLGKVYGLALRITGQADAAEEVTVEVYHQAWRQADRFDPARGRPLAWLLTLTRSRSLDWLRRRDEAAPHPQPERLIDPMSATGADPLDLLLGVERDGLLHAALSRLTSVQRQLLTLAFYQDLSHREIADHTRLPLGTVKTHIRKGLAQLQATLAHGVPL